MNDSMTGLQEFLRALASENRQTIFFKVFAGGGEYTVGQVAELLNIGQSTASEQLAILKRARLLQSRKEGKEVHYRPDSEHILKILAQLAEMIAHCCPPDSP